MFFRTIETPDFFCFSKFSFLTFYGKYFRMTFFLPRYNVNSKFEYSLQVWRNLGPTYCWSNIAKKYHADKAPIWSVIGPTKDQHYFSSISANYVRPIYHQFGPLMDRHRTNIQLVQHRQKISCRYSTYFVRYRTDIGPTLYQYNIVKQFIEPTTATLQWGVL